MLDPFHLQRRFVTALLIASLSSGCTTLYAKNDEGVGYPFAGMRDMPCQFWLSLAVFPPLTWVALPFIIVDIPLSLTADVLFLPFDLASPNPEPRRRSGPSCGMS